MNNHSIKRKFEEIVHGEQAHFSVIITEKMVNEFGRLSGDMNPLHMNTSYALHTPFKQRVVHGMLGGALISRLVGMYLPGKYALYLKQTLNFHKPMFVGMEVFITGVVVAKTDATRTLEIETVVKNNADILISGRALVQVTR